MVLALKILIAFLLPLSSCASPNIPAALAFESNPDFDVMHNSSIRKPEPAVEPEPVIIFERHVLAAEDYLTDPSIHISTPRISPVSPDRSIAQRGLSTVETLDKEVRALAYDPAAKLIKDSKMPSEVMSTGSGNCFEVARLAMEKLTREGYNAHLIDIKTAHGHHWHTICVFQEIDGTWSFFQASDKNMGYTKAGSPSIDLMIPVFFHNITEVKIVI